MVNANPFKQNINLKKKIVNQGIFASEVKSFLSEMLEQEGFSHIRVRNIASKIEIVIFSVETLSVIGEGGRMFNEIKSLIGQRFGLSPDEYTIFVEKITDKGLSAAAQADSVKFKLIEGFKGRRAALSVMDFVMKSKAQGVEVEISGKLRGQRGKTVKFKSGYMIKSGEGRNMYVEEAIRHVKMKQGILGVRVRIQRPHDPTGRKGPKKRLPDVCIVREPEEETSKVLEEGESPVKLEQQTVIIPQTQHVERNVNQHGLIDQGGRRLNE